MTFGQFIAEQYDTEGLVELLTENTTLEQLKDTYDKYVNDTIDQLIEIDRIQTDELKHEYTVEITATIVRRIVAKNKEEMQRKLYEELTTHSFRLVNHKYTTKIIEED